MKYVSEADIKKTAEALDDLVRQRRSAGEAFGNRVPTLREFARMVTGLEMDKWQDEYLLAAPKHARISIAASRQSGKSTVTAIFCAYLLIFMPGTMILVASRSLRQASHYIDKIRPIILGVVPRKSMPQLNRLSLELPNGSLIVSVPTAQPDAGRGFSPHLMIVDEAAFAPDALFTAMMPSVAATHGALHMISSPNGRQGRFFEAFEGESQDVFWTQRITWKDCPRMTQEQMDIERRALGDVAFRQEMLSEFLTPHGSFLHADTISRFEDGMELQDFTGLELDDLEDIAAAKFTDPTTQLADLQAAVDVADRVSRKFFEPAEGA